MPTMFGTATGGNRCTRTPSTLRYWHGHAPPLERLPPLGFIAMREHLNYFTPGALKALLTRNGFNVDTCGLDDAGQLFAVARKCGIPAPECGMTNDDNNGSMINSPSFQPSKSA